MVKCKDYGYLAVRDEYNDQIASPRLSPFVLNALSNFTSFEFKIRDDWQVI